LKELSCEGREKNHIFYLRNAWGGGPSRRGQGVPEPSFAHRSQEFLLGGIPLVSGLGSNAVARRGKYSRRTYPGEAVLVIADLSGGEYD